MSSSFVCYLIHVALFLVFPRAYDFIASSFDNTTHRLPFALNSSCNIAKLRSLSNLPALFFFLFWGLSSSYLLLLFSSCVGWFELFCVFLFSLFPFSGVVWFVLLCFLDPLFPVRVLYFASLCSLVFVVLLSVLFLSCSVSCFVFPFGFLVLFFIPVPLFYSVFYLCYEFKVNLCFFFFRLSGCVFSCVLSLGLISVSSFSGCLVVFSVVFWVWGKVLFFFFRLSLVVLPCFHLSHQSCEVSKSS